MVERFRSSPNANTAQTTRLLKEPNTEGEGQVVQPLRTSRYVTVEPVIVNLSYADRYVFTGLDVQTAAKLTGPTVGSDRWSTDCCGKATELTAADQRMDKGFQLAVVPAPGVARANNVGNQVLVHTQSVLGGVSHVELNGDMLSEVSGGCQTKSVQILAVTAGRRRFQVIECVACREIKFWVITVLGKRCTSTQKYQA